MAQVSIYWHSDPEALYGQWYARYTDHGSPCITVRLHSTRPEEDDRRLCTEAAARLKARLHAGGERYAATAYKIQGV